MKDEQRTWMLNRMDEVESNSKKWPRWMRYQWTRIAPEDEQRRGKPTPSDLQCGTRRSADIAKNGAH